MRTLRRFKKILPVFLLILQILFSFAPLTILIPTASAQEADPQPVQIDSQLKLDNYRGDFAVYYVVDGQIMAHQGTSDGNLDLFLGSVSGEDQIKHNPDRVVVKTEGQTYHLLMQQVENSYGDSNLDLSSADEDFLFNNWQIEDAVATTKEVVRSGITYTFPLNNLVQVRFNRLPENPSTLTIEEISLSADLQAELGAVSPVAYDVRTEMPDGEFNYDLILPKSETDEEVVVKYAESLAELEQADVVTEAIEVEEETVTVNDLDHMTLFIVVKVVNLGITLPFDGPNDNVGDVWVYRASAGAETSLVADPTGSVPEQWRTEVVKMNAPGLGRSYLGYRGFSWETVASSNLKEISWYKYAADTNNDHYLNFFIYQGLTKYGTVIIVPKCSEFGVWKQCSTNGVGVDVHYNYYSTSGHWWTWGWKSVTASFANFADFMQSDFKNWFFYNDPETDSSLTIVSGSSTTNTDLLNYVDGVRFVYKDDSDDIYNFEAEADLVRPTVSLSPAAPGLTNQATTTVDITFSEEVTDLSENDLDLTNAEVVVGSFSCSNAQNYCQVELKAITDGLVKMKVRENAVFDNAGLGNEASEVYSYTVDTTPPSVPVLTWPIGGEYINDNTPLMQWDDSSDNMGVGLKGYLYRIYYNCSDVNNSSTCTSVYPNSNGLFLGNSQYQAGVTPDNVYYWQVRAEDQAGNQSDWSALGKMVIDTTVPEVPSGIYFKDTVNNKTILCGGKTNTNHINVYWNSIINDPTFSHFEYSSFDAPNGNAGLVERRFDTNYFASSWWTIPMEGVYGVQLRSVDLAGNKSAWSGGAVGIDHSCQYIVDWTAPATPILDFPEDGYQTQGIAFDQSWYPVSDAIGYEYQSCHIDPGDLGGDCTNIRWPQTFDGVDNVNKHVEAGQPNGKFWWRVRSKDAAGNFSSWSESREITVDNTAPTSTIITPNIANGNTLITNDWDGSLSGEASDSLSGVARVELEIDYDGSITIATASGTTAWTYNLPEVSEGTYTISSHAVDNAGNREDTYEVTIVLDKTIPEVDLTVTPTDPDGSGNWYITRPEVTLTDSDNFAVDYIQYRWGATGSWNTYSAPLLLPAEGTNPLYYRAVDQAGNLSEEGIKTLQWDQTELTEGPLNIKADPNPTAESSSTISWDDATDNIGINKYQVTWDLRDGDDKHSKEVAGDVTETEINELKEGSYKITVTAYDGSGYNRSASTTLIVDRTAPVAPSLTLTDSRAGEVDLSWTAVADATRYIIYYGLEAGNYLYAADVGNVTNYTVQGLTAGNYYFVVRAVDESDNQGANSNEVSILALTGAPAGTIVAEGFTEAGVVQGETTEASAEEQAAMNEEIAKQGEVKGAAITCTNLSKSLFWIFLVVQAVIMLLLAKFSKRAWLKLLAFLLLPALFTVIIRRMGLANCFSNETMIWLSNNYYLPAYLAAMLTKILELLLITD